MPCIGIDSNDVKMPNHLHVRLLMCVEQTNRLRMCVYVYAMSVKWLRNYVSRSQEPDSYRCRGAFPQQLPARKSLK
jgi:hypothetical protein